MCPLVSPQAAYLSSATTPSGSTVKSPLAFTVTGVLKLAASGLTLPGPLRDLSRISQAAGKELRMACLRLWLMLLPFSNLKGRAGHEESHGRLAAKSQR